MKPARSDKQTTFAPTVFADARDLRAVISRALAAHPHRDRSLRRGIWTYVGAERAAGKSPGRVIMALTGLVEEANIQPTATRHALMRRVLVWCVEAYFGHLGGDFVGRDGQALADVPMLGAGRPAIEAP